MELRNIHFTNDTAAAVQDEAPPSARMRKVTVSPHEEYQLREGQVAPISDALAAMICAMKGRVKITGKGIEIERVDLGEKRFYHHPDSPACNDLSYRTRKIFYVLNRQKPHVVHLLDDSGRYLESLPEKGTPDVGDNAAQARELAGLQRQINRMAGHLQDVHGKDTNAKLAEVRENHGSIKRLTQTLAASVPNAETPAPASPIGERMQTVEKRHADRLQFLRSAKDFGRAVSLERPVNTRTPDSAHDAEDWTSSPKSTRTHQPTSPIESW